MSQSFALFLSLSLLRSYWVKLLPLHVAQNRKTLDYKWSSCSSCLYQSPTKTNKGAYNFWCVKKLLSILSTISMLFTSKYKCRKTCCLWPSQIYGSATSFQMFRSFLLYSQKSWYWQHYLQFINSLHEIFLSQVIIIIFHKKFELIIEMHTITE